ncbi:retrovirus-related pol polyprotein from transposon TNT 1-94 [Tanacetum coccineum]
MFVPSDSTVPKLQTAEDLQGDALLHYDAEMELMNLILLSIPNEIYNSVDACTTAKEMWKRVFFVAEPGEALVSVYNRFAKNSGNNGRNTRCAYVQEEVVEGSNAQNETRNVQRTLRTSSSGNTSTVQCYNYSGKGHYARNCPKPRVRDSKMEEIEELSVNICLMARIQPANNTSDTGPSYDSAFISEVQSSSINENKEQIGSVEKDTHVPDLYALKQLARNAYLEAEKQQLFAQKVQQQNTTLTNQLELYKERVRVLENINGDNNYLNKFLEADQKAKHFNQQAQSQFIHLKAKLKKNVDLMLKLGNSLQGMFMLGPKPLSVYDPQLKHGLGYSNPYILKQAISQCPKLYLASSLSNSEIPLNIRDTEDTLDDAFKNQVKPIVNELQFYFEFFRKLMKEVFESTESELCEIEKQNDFLKDQLVEASLRHEVKISVLLNHECIDNSLHAEIERIKKNCIEIQENFQEKIKILEKDVQRCQKQSVDFELKLQHEKEKHKWESTLNNKNTNPLDYSWISKMEKLDNENVSLEFQVQSLIKERDNVKLEYQKLFDSIKKTRSQSQKEMDELIKHVSEKTYAYGVIRAENQNLLSTISELKTRLETVEKGKSVNTKFDMTNVSQNLLCVTPLNKQVFQKKTVVSKTKEKHVVSKPVTLQTSPDKQRGANSNKNVIVPGMYRVVTTQESQTNEAKSDLSSTRMNVASSVRRPMNRDSHVKNSVLANSKNSAKKVAVYVRKNKQTDNTSANVISNKENVNDDNVANAAKAKTLLCVSCMQNVLIPCHDKCLAKYKLNVHSNVRRALSTNSRTPKSSDTTYVVLKTRFSEKLTQSKSLDTTSVVSKPKIDVESASKAKHKVVQIVLWIVDSGCSKHITGDRSLLRNFIETFMGTVRFENDNFVAIIGYGDYIEGNITICHVYCVEGLGHNLFSVGQFCDGDLEVAFRSKTCYVRNLEGDDLLTGGRESNLYTISISDMAASSPVCLMSKATSTKSWLWHRRLSHLNFGTINDLTRFDLVDGLPKFKYGKDHLCSACERGKSKKASHPPKLVPSDHSKLELLHMDLCGPMRVASINGKKYILVIVDDYSRYTWV